MTARFSQKVSIPAGILTLLGLLLSAKARSESADGWIDSRPFLVETPKPESPQGLLFTKPLYAAITRSLMNPEQHRQLLDMQTRMGTKALDVRPHSLSIFKLSANETSARPSDVTRSMSTFLGREFKSSAMPESLRTGFAFNFGTKSPQAAVDAPRPVRYGLIVTNVEPSPESFRLAALPMTSVDEYALVSYAPKAQVHYAIGPLTPEQDLADSTLPLGETGSTSWLHGLPELQFRGKIAARGAPTANQIVPPQTITLEQTQGFYALEVQTSQLVHKDALFHRIRVPLAGSMSLREERNEKFKRTRSTLENIYARGPLALNLDYFGLEKRYQTALIYQKFLTRIEFYNQLPNGIVKNQRFELRVQTGF